MKDGLLRIHRYTCIVSVNGGGAFINTYRMRKFLEVLVDDDGKYHFSTDETFEGIPSPKVFDKEFKHLLHDMTEFMWQNKQQKVSQAIRMLSMAEMLGGAQPYEMAYEAFATEIKKPFGFDSKAVTRPVTGGSGVQVFPINRLFSGKPN